MSPATTSKTVTFALPFLLKGVDGVLPAGDYRVVTDEELIEGLSFSGLPARVDYDFSADKISSSSRDAHGRSSRSSGCTRSRRIVDADTDLPLAGVDGVIAPVLVESRGRWDGA